MGLLKNNQFLEKTLNKNFRFRIHKIFFFFVGTFLISSMIISLVFASRGH